GMITGFENLGYIMSHHTRDIQKAAVTETEAAAKVSPRPKILSHNLTIIPTNGKNEVFCHEFKCENEDGKHFITYINANNGREEKLLILLEDESGTLTL
ncbi:MAG: germination protein YpeB, partial [Oscillospiraceae bacterium]